MSTLNLGLVLIILGFMLETKMGESMRFELDSGQTKCISEDIRTNAMSVGKYAIVNPHQDSLPHSHKLTVKVSSPYGHSYHIGEDVDSGNFAFTATENGAYTSCFWAINHQPPVKLTIDFVWRTGVAAKDWSQVAKKGQVDTMEFELKKLHDTVTYIHEEMYYLRGRYEITSFVITIPYLINLIFESQHLQYREEEMQHLNKETNSTMAALSFFSIVVCLSVAGLQVWHLKTFFQRKKLL
ncbi:hypothetical protein J1N35_019483 [Gossypium stocksii]|uniref:GOLD domain-containing protein n=1 Tax=Gossypium stocksii TaxID=47602 RepID=A0A9D3VR14_9ROSI|nr:hypothetical protein J1N35_019483 [Gossypium stocksii]